MIDLAGVAEVECINDLEEDTLDQLIISEECELPDDGLEIAGTEIVDEEHVMARIDFAMEGEDVGVE